MIKNLMSDLQDLNHSLTACDCACGVATSKKRETAFKPKERMQTNMDVPTLRRVRHKLPILAFFMEGTLSWFGPSYTKGMAC